MNTSRFESLTGSVDIVFPEYDDPPLEPITLLRRWLAAADAARVREPKALALATARADGRSSTRIIAFSSIDDLGLIFAHIRRAAKAANSARRAGLPACSIGAKPDSRS